VAVAVAGICNITRSVGAVLVEMATGQPPWADLVPVAALFKLGSPDAVPTIPAFLSADARHFLSLCFTRYTWPPSPPRMLGSARLYTLCPPPPPRLIVATLVGFGGLGWGVHQGSHPASECEGAIGPPFPPGLTLAAISSLCLVRLPPPLLPRHGTAGQFLLFLEGLLTGLGKLLRPVFMKERADGLL
jgi:hypothetical protein